MIWGMIKSFVSNALGFNISTVESSSSIISPFAVYGSLFMFIFMMTILIKAGLGAFKDTEVEKMDPVEDFQNLMQERQREQQRQQQRKNIQIDRVKK